MDGLNFRTSGDILGDNFRVDQYGSFIPDRGKLRTEMVAQRMKRQLSAKTGLYRRLAEIYYRTDVEFPDNPLGNTPVIGVGVKLLGPRPKNLKRGKRLQELRGEGQNVTEQLKRRERKIEALQTELMDLHASLEPTERSGQKSILWKVEGDQVLTGGGFDNNSIGEVTKSALNFVSDSSAEIDYADSDLSKIVVEGALWIKDLLVSQGLILGSLQPMGASVVRAEQDSDGMFGWPVYAKGNDALSQDLAKRLLIESGVDTSASIGTMVIDSTTREKYPYRVIDAGGAILDSKVFTADDMVSLVTLLARIQKHGWKMEDGHFKAKPGKTRSVYPNAFIPALIEAMIMTPFNNALKEHKVSIMPSLQDKPTRVQMIREQILGALQKGYDYLAADWSKYDASVKGAILATIIQLAVKPFFKAQYYYWVDAATYILTYKYLICDTELCKINAEAYDLAKKSAPAYAEVSNYTIFSLVDGLISGAKFTHVGGSLYGECVVHYGIGRLLGYEPISGPQAGDDTLMGVPLKLIDTSSVENTYNPIVEASSKFGLHINASKQIFHQDSGEIVKVFLQDSYHAATDTWGIGSIFRPVDAVFYSEREKGLTIQEQLFAEIARMNQGADSPFCPSVVAWWLNKEKYLGWLFKTYGVSGFQELIDSAGMTAEELAKKVGVGSFTFSIDMSDVRAGTIPILSVMADVASQMSFSSEDKASFLSTPNPSGVEEEDDVESTGIIQGDD